MKRNVLWCALALAALCAPLAAWPAFATRPAQGRADPAPFALVKDINTAPQPRGSMFIDTIFAVINDTLLFSASTPQTGVELWASDGTSGGTRLVKDINRGEDGSLDSNTSEPASIVLKGQLLFGPDDGAHGNELWASDGTKGGTRFVKDLFLGANASRPHGFVADGDRAFFAAQAPQNAQALWVSDGTPEGTRLLHTFAAMFGAPVLAGSTLFFVAATQGDDFELWRSDGTPAGTAMVKDIWPGPSGGVQGELFARGPREVWFSASDGSSGPELWTSDGTADGTHVFRGPEKGVPILRPNGFVALHKHRAGTNDGPDSILFSADDGTHGNELWASDGAPDNTAMVKDVNPNAPGNFIQFLGFAATLNGRERAIFSFNNNSSGTIPFVSDGTSDGTQPLVNDASAMSTNPSRVTTIGDTSYFAATDPQKGRELWKTDGTAKGTTIVDINLGASSEPQDLTVFDGKLYFTADDGKHGRELWQSDASGTSMVRDIWLGIAPGAQHVLGVANNALYFAANDGTTGDELWKTDGTGPGTALVQNIAPDTGGINLSPSFNAAALGDKLIFGVDPMLSGASNASALGRITAETQRRRENSSYLSASAPLRPCGECFTAERNATASLWRSDGTAAGTAALSTFQTIPFLPTFFGMATLGDGVLFSGTDGEDVLQLWRTDGTQAGTAIVTNTVRPNFGYAINLARLNNKVLFSVLTKPHPNDPLDSKSLWSSDGTPQGTRLVIKDVAFDPFNYAVSGDTAFFAHAPNGTNDDELWATDGTAAGTRQVRDINPGDDGSYPYLLTPGRPGEVFFVARPDGNEDQLWKSDGTNDGTVLVHTFGAAGAEFFIDRMAYADGRLFFIDNDDVHGVELWSSDGTPGGTGPVADIFPGRGSSTPSNLLELNGELFFSATGPDGRRTLWHSDGTKQGTQPLRDDADAPLNPTNLAVANGKLLFSAADEAHGREPWRSDGTAIGTRMIQDIVPGDASSNPQSFVVVGLQLFLTADTPGVGRELWALPPNAPDPSKPTPTPDPSSPTPTPGPTQPGPGQSRRIYLPLVAQR